MKHFPALLALVMLFPLRAVSERPGRSLGPVEMDSYKQTLFITFRSEAAAQQAHLRMCGLYHDAQAGFSTRMDDSNLNDLRVAEVMQRCGQKGTFMLNDPYHWWQDSTETGITAPAEPAREIPSRLLAGGNSIGGHTLAHEMMPALSKNAAFREILGARIALEAVSTSPNVAFVYPFIFYQSPLRDGVDRADLDEMLRRSGYSCLAEDRYNQDWNSGMVDTVFVSLDGNSDYDRIGQQRIANFHPNEERPLFLVTMHAWVKAWGGPDYPKLAELYQKWSGRQDWWYCNLNQYSAYRYQYQHTQMATFVAGNRLKVVLTRPDPRDLGDDIPLTFRVDGVPGKEVSEVTSADTEVQPVASDAGYTFDLFHRQQHASPETYAQVENKTNAPEADPEARATEGLRAWIHRRPEGIDLNLRNDGREPLREVRVIFRLPLGWSTGVVRHRVGMIKAGEAITLKVPFSEAEDAAHYRDGSEFDCAQIDFIAEHRARVYATCDVPSVEPAASFARNGFRVLGPLPGDMAEFDPRTFAEPFLKGESLHSTYPVPWGEALTWKTLPASKASLLDPDIIPTAGRPNVPANYAGDPDIYFPHRKLSYLLHGNIVSPDTRTVRAIFSPAAVAALWLNGEKIEGDRLPLKSGKNDLRIFYYPAPNPTTTFDEKNYGCYFRLTGDDGGRVKDVRFERPRKP